MRLPDDVSEYLAAIGRRGGRAKSERKTAAARANARKRWQAKKK